MSARRHVLEDSSDESESGDVGINSNTFKFLTDNQLSEIEECNIKSDGDGTYSADAMDLAISQNEANLVQLEDEAQSQLNYQQYQVMKDKIDAFLAKPIWNRSGEPSEEVLLLEIEALRRSSKKTKINMFKHNSKTGGQVMFGPWWNYALQRIVHISSDNNTNNNNDLDWESYTSGRILLSLFAFVTESTDVVKKGKLADLKSAFGVDWDNNVKTARKVISRYAQDSILDEECTKCELHVDSLRGALPSNDKTKDQKSVASVPSSISLKAMHSDNGDKKKPEDEEKKKREDEARKKRMAAMKASQRRASAFSVSIEQSRAKIDAVSSTTLHSTATSSMPVADLRPQTSSGRPQNDAPNQMKPPPARFIPPVQAPDQMMKPPPARFTPPVQAPDQMMKPPPARFIPPVQAPDQMMKPPPARFIPPVQQSTANSDPRAQQFHTATNTSSLYNSAPDDKRIESTANTIASFTSQNDYSYGQSHEPKQSASHGTYSQLASSSNDGMRPQAPRDDDVNDRLYRSQQDSREDRNNRYNDRSSDYGKKRDAGYEQSYNRGDSREYSTSRGYDDERPNKRSRGPDDNERSSMNYGSSAPKMGATEKWQSQQEPKTSKYEHPGPARGAAFTAPAAGGGRGRGRGGVDNRPAWMTQRGQSAPNGSAASATVGGQQPAADPGAAFTAPAAGAGRGRGRGGVDNRPAWMTRGQGAPVNARAPASVADTQSSTVSVGEAAFSVPPTAVGRGRGRGGVDNRPAWMIKGQNAHTNNTALKPGGAAPSGGAAFGTQAAVGGMGRGRGRGRGRGIDNRPAWMSKQESQQDN
ncbi:hypothetical protein QTG54_012773 [Skeletonema marinoi]|uniref:Uncharacterized protein n=1 Tax=Skeletonema marinoi TaxID=267567 RepID=A0AAD9D786_9STRA|nr:hypothetical protein QTG54_012773 [Skeletonema marinoi]